MFSCKFSERCPGLLSPNWEIINSDFQIQKHRQRRIQDTVKHLNSLKTSFNFDREVNVSLIHT